MTYLYMRMNLNYSEKKLFDMMYEAGEIAREYFMSHKDIDYNIKKDDTPVSEADIAIDKFIKIYIKNNFPTASILSEEDSEDNQLKIIDSDELFIIDPIDGTDSFITGGKYFTVNISYLHDNHLIFSVIYAPMLDLMMYADEHSTYEISKKNDNYQKNKITNDSINKNINQKLRIITTRRSDEILEIKLYLKSLRISYNLVHYSSSIKFCYIANDKADMYIRKANIRIWDVTAGFHMANNSGCCIQDTRKENLYSYFLQKDYLKKISSNNFRVEEFIIAKKGLF